MRDGEQQPSAGARRRRHSFATSLAVLCALGTPLVLPLAAVPQQQAEAAEPRLPLQPERSLELTTDEVTWLSLDVAADDGTIVFDALGDLYTLAPAGGEAVPLVTGMAFDSQPALSPDGGEIAFLSDRDGAENLWIMRRDGSEPRQISRETAADFASPSWTPDGDYVLVSISKKGVGTFELFLFHRLGGQGVQVTEASAKPDTPRDQRHNALGAIASPDGRYFYYAQRTGGFEYNAAMPMWQIARRDRTTGDEDAITAAEGSAFRPRLSPDGKQLVYATRRDNQTGLKVRELASGEERWLAYPVQRDDQESRFTRDLYPGYAFTPDGRALVVTWNGKLHRLELESGSVSEVPFTVPVDLELGPRLSFPHRVDEGPVRARLAMGAVASPDGKQVVFSALARLYVADLEGDPKPRPLTPPGQRAFQPTWSPTSSEVAYVTWSETGGHIWRLAVQGGEPRRLTEVAAFYAEPSWSPDGTRIVALRASRQARLEMPSEFGGPGLAKDLVWLPSAGGPLELIAPSRGLGRPHFTDEDDRVYVYSQEGLVSMRFDGTDRREHLAVTGPGLYFTNEPVPARELQISPDRRNVLASVSNRFYLVTLPRVGGEAPKVDLAKPSVPLRKLTLLGADSFAWADGGKTITWTLGSSFHRLPLDQVELDMPVPVPAPAAGGQAPADARAAEPEELPEPERFELVVEVPRARPRGLLALRGATIVTMAGDEVIASGDVLIEDNRIRAVGAAGTVTIPQAAQVVDVDGLYIVPGFVDTHAHWTEIRRGVLDLESWPFLANLAWGVTTGLDVQTGTTDTFAYQDLIDAGEMLGPRAFSTGPGIFSDNDIQSLEQARGILHRYRDHYRTQNLKAYLTGNRRQRQLLVQAAHELHMMPTTEGSLDLELDLTHAIDGFAGNEHALPIVPLFEDVVELFARSGIGYTPTLLVAYGGPWAENAFYTSETVHDRPKLRRFVPHDTLDQKTRRRTWFRAGEHVYPQLAAQARKIVRAGGRVGVGGHGQLQGLGYHWEMWALASGGLTPHEVLRAATLHGAEIIGLGDDLGSITAGKLADLVILGENPLDDIRHTDSLRYVVKNGELFEAATLDRLWPEPRPLEPRWWWSEGPQTATARAGSPEAAAAYERGRSLWRTRGREALLASVGHFEHALELDPYSARTWAGLADSLALLGLYSILPPDQSMPRAFEAAQRALALDDTIAEAHASLGLARYLWDWDFAGAERQFLRAIELDPGYAPSHHWYGMLLSAVGRHAESVEQLRQAVALEPDSPLLNVKLATVLVSARRYEEAQAQLDKALARFPSYALAHRELGFLDLARGQPAAALAAFERAAELAGGESRSSGGLGHTYAVTGRREDAERILLGMLESAAASDQPPMYLALVYAGLGETDKALDWLERGERMRDPGLVYIHVKPGFERLRSDERFRALSRRMGFPPRASAGTGTSASSPGRI